MIEQKHFSLHACSLSIMCLHTLVPEIQKKISKTCKTKYTEKGSQDGQVYNNKLKN